MTRKSKIRLAQESKKRQEPAADVKQQKEPAEEGKQMKRLLPVIGGAAAVGGVLYVVNAPTFFILLAAAGTALITGVKIWGRR
jgi:Flp pilus assembly protein TadB